MRTRQLLLVLVATGTVLAGCSGSGSDASADPDALAARLTKARTTLDTAETVTISLATTRLPSGVTGLLSAKGRGNHSPAFTGTVKVVTGGTSVSADVIATGGTVWAKTSFAPVYLTIDPASLKAPDPASLLAPDDGISQILTSTTSLRDGGRSREGSEVLTTIKGQLPGTLVRDIIPSAAAGSTFAVTYRLDGDDVLQDATLRGKFYPKGGDVTYTVALRASDTPVTVKAP